MAVTKTSFELQNNLSELDKMCRHLETFGDSVGISPKCMFRLNLVMEELVANIISYGLADNHPHQITIDLVCDKGRLDICIEDEGVAFNPVEADAPDTRCSLEDRDIGGLGIHLAKKYVSKIHYKRCDCKNILTLNMAIK